MSAVLDFLSVFYPRLCAGCGKALHGHEQTICLECKANLPRTQFHKHAGNLAEQTFWGRTRIENAASYVFFQREGRVQQLLHNIKYKNVKEAAVELGKWYGAELKTEANWINDVDLIIPVPLHESKLKKRGYNQSECFAYGLSKSLNITLDTISLKRKLATETQTKKSRYMRWQNVAEVFEVEQPEKLENKHIILVDDVLTTGATLEACAQAIFAVTCPNKISVLTLAFANV